jgi:hypothetical protein
MVKTVITKTHIPRCKGEILLIIKKDEIISKMKKYEKRYEGKC